MHSHIAMRPIFITAIAYFLITAFISIFMLFILFCLACGSELSMPFVAENRLPIIERGYYNNSSLLGWTLKPNLEVSLIKKNEPAVSKPYFSTNASGFRVTPIAQANQPTGIILGDSFAQGFYLTDTQSIPWRIAEQTKNNVINTGVGGYSTDQELITLEKVISPGVSWVILLFFANDLPWNLERTNWALHKPRYKITGDQVNFSILEAPASSNIPPSESISNTNKIELCCIYDGSKLLELTKFKFSRYFELIPSPMKLIHQIREDYKWSFPYKAQYSYIMPTKFYQNPASFQREWHIAFQMIARMKDLSQKNQAKFYAVYVPEIGQLLNQDGIGNKNLPQQYFMELCVRHHITCIDPSEQFAKNAMQIYVQDDGHFSPYGANLMAKILSGYIK